jgi:hypothetical protein
MGKTVSLSNAGNSGRSWFSNAIGGAWKLMKQGIALPVAKNSPLCAEVFSLTAPHLPVLVHKRTKFLEVHGASQNASWMLELNHFAVRSICPHLAAESPDRKCVLEILDDIVSVEQGRIAAAACANNPPYTSRFDTSWAI